MLGIGWDGGDGETAVQSETRDPLAQETPQETQMETEETREETPAQDSTATTVSKTTTTTAVDKNKAGKYIPPPPKLTNPNTPCYKLPILNPKITNYTPYIQINPL